MQEITCSYNITCLISIEEINKIPLLKLDMNIRSYQVLDKSWITHNIPPGVMVDDKLYLDEEMKNKVCDILDCFIKKGSIQSSTNQITSRGFSYFEHEDKNGNIISIQDSSAASSPHVWFGLKMNQHFFTLEGDKKVAFYIPHNNILLEERLHLNKSQAKMLKKAITVEWNFYNLNKSLPDKDDKTNKNKI